MFVPEALTVKLMFSPTVRLVSGCARISLTIGGSTREAHPDDRAIVMMSTALARPLRCIIFGPFLG
jgi:hypothetical protein